MDQSPMTAQPTKDERAEAEEALDEAAREHPEEIKQEEIARKIVDIPPVAEDNLVKGLDP